MADWKDRYLQASFRGVEFFISDHSQGGGRRLAVYEFPEQDGAQIEDLGRKPRSFGISAYVIGSDYYRNREGLQSALETPGPGRLVHPYKGVLSVSVEDFTLSERTTEGRMARFDISFIEHNEDAGPQVVQNTSRQVKKNKQQLYSAATEDFVETFNPDSPANPVGTLQNTLNTVDGVLDTLEGIKTIANQAAEFKRLLQDSKGSAIRLIGDAAGLATSIGEIVDYANDPAPGQALNNAWDLYREQLNIISTMVEPVTDAPTELYTADYPPQQIQDLIKIQAAASLGGIVADLPLTNVQQARDVLKETFDILDNLQAESTDSVFSAVEDIQTSIESDLNTRILNLKIVTELNIPEDQPSLVIAYRVYGNLENEQSIINRNRIQHPGFITAAHPVEVEI